MPPPPKTLSPAELAKLEHAFATDPASEAYKPLAEAYLGMGRFMEAMVVCKKGVKAHPSLADPRVLLARVYADQGKDKKALEELQGALGVQPADRPALRLTAALQFKGGEGEAARATLQKAYEVDPTDGETLELFEKHGVAVPKKEAPPPPPPPAPVVVQAPMAPAEADADDGQTPPPAPPRRSGPGSGARAAARAAARPAARRPARDDDEEPVSELTDLPEPRRKSSGSAAGRAVFFLLIFTVPLAAGAYYGIGQWKAKRAREVKKLLEATNDLLKKDTWDSYKKAIESANAALDIDPSSGKAHSYLAYAYAVRWGEHERDDQNRKEAEEHLKEAEASKDNLPSFVYAAEALIPYYGGKRADALKAIEERVKSAEAENKRSALLYLTLGLIQMNQGDLERARESLEKAQNLAPDDPRVYVSLGNLMRRRGADGQALNYFNSALKYSHNSHPDALVGTALLILDQENPGAGYGTAAKYLKSLLESDPPPSPRQLGMANFVKALMVSRVSADLPRYTKEEFRKELEASTGVGPDAAKAADQVKKLELEGESHGQSPDYFIVRAKRFLYEEQLDKAAAEVRRAIEIDNTQANYHVELARVLMKKEGGEKDAEEALRRALSLVPGSPKLLSLLGQVLYREKRVDDARATLEQAVADVKTKNPEARYLLGRIYRDDKKDYEKATAMLEKAATEYYSDSTMAATTYDDLAQAYDLKGDKDRARVNFEKALSADRDYDAAYCHYVRFMTRGADPKDKDKTKAVAGEYLKLAPKGECAADMQRASQG
jgi:tetratricopeptide (TPR) repeat protein